MKLAAIDIGSNAVRMKVVRVTHVNREPQFKKIEYLRFPLMLGEDVFETNIISPRNEHRLMQLLQAFKLLLNLYEVTDYMVCATASWRAANNGLAVKAKIDETLQMCVNIIDGNEEATLISKAIHPFLKGGDYFHIEVGGGSTELSFYREQARQASRSFRIGYISQKTMPDIEEVWADMQAWVCKQQPDYKNGLIGIATGGNIRKLAQIIGYSKREMIAVRRLMTAQSYVASYDEIERINMLHLNPDRSSAILPASEIYLTTMQWANVKHVLVPDVGLRDGILKELYEKYVQNLS